MVRYQDKEKNLTHTFINIGLSLFLIIIVAIAIYSLNDFDIVQMSSVEQPSLIKFMVCSLGKCSLF
jgi:hypothetical protein